MRTIRRLIIHASGSPRGRDDTSADIDRWHKERGWKGIGYHYVIRINGVIETGRPLKDKGAHVAHHNHDSIGVCLIGEGFALSDFTEAQKSALRRLRKELEQQFPHITVHGHREFANKSCPGFDIVDFPWAVSLSPTPQQPTKIKRPWWKFW